MKPETVYLYIPGLGDGYDSLRRLMLKTWSRHKHSTARLISMHWLGEETFEQKQQRIIDVVTSYPDTSRIVIVGESAGGAMTISLMNKLGHCVDSFVTICGKNRRPHDLSPYLASKNIALRDAIAASEETASHLSDEQKRSLLVMRSSLDPVINAINTRVEGSREYVRSVPGHLLSIAYFGLFAFKQISQ